MKLIKPILIIAILLLVSCDKTNIYATIDNNFKDNRWFKSSTRTLKLEVKKDASNYDLLFDFRHVHDFQFSEIPIQFRIEDPNGKVSIKKIMLSIKDEKGKDRGECMGDICDLRQVIFSEKELIKGDYTISISHQFQGEYLPNVISIGLSLKEILK